MSEKDGCKSVCKRSENYRITFFENINNKMSILKFFYSKYNVSETKQKIYSNIFWAVFGKVVSLFGSLLVGILVAKYLGPEQYGLMSYVISFVSLFQILATFGMDNIEIREEATNSEEKEKIIGTAFVLRLILSFITIFLITIVAIFNEADSFTITLVLLYSCSIIFLSFDVIRNYFTSIVQNEYVVKVGIIRTVLSCIIKFLLVVFHAPLLPFVATFVFDGLIGAQGYYSAYRKKVGPIWNKWYFDKVTAKLLIKQSFPLLLSGAAATIFLQIDQVMIGNMINKESVGYFSVASKMVEIAMFIPTILSQTITPILVQSKKENECAYKSKVQEFLNISLWLSIIMSILLSILSKLIIDITFGIEYDASVIILAILSYKVIATTLNISSGQILIIDQKQKLFVLRSLSGCICCIVLNMLFIPVYGIKSVAVIAIITQLVAGFIIHTFIPAYKYMFRMQVVSIVFGWRSLLNIKHLLK